MAEAHSESCIRRKAHNVGGGRRDAVLRVLAHGVRHFISVTVVELLTLAWDDA